MPPPLPPPLRAGQAPDARSWNDLLRTVAQGSHVSAAAFGEIGVSETAGGVQILDGRPRRHWAKITSRGTGNLYAHTAVAPNVAGGFTDLPQDADNPYGTATTNGVPAREIHARVDFDASLPVYAELWPDEAGGGWLFDVGGSVANNISLASATATVGSISVTVDDTWTTVSNVLNIPSSGTYLIAAWSYGTEVTSSTGQGQTWMRVWNSTDSTEAILPTLVIEQRGTDENNINCFGTASYAQPVTFSGAKTLVLQWKRNIGGGGSFVSCTSSAGVLSYVKLA